MMNSADPLSLLILADECRRLSIDQLEMVRAGIGVFAGGHMTPFERIVNRSEILSPVEKYVLRLGGK